MKAAIFHPAAVAAVRLFPKDVRRERGKAIFDLQKGEVLTMPISRAMPSVAPGVAEVRIRDHSGIYRVFYYVASPRGILVFHAFVKKTQGTPKHELHLAKKRLKGLLNEEV